MFRLDENNDLIFSAVDLKEIYEPIITQFGFKYEACLDRYKKGLIWTKLYERNGDCDHLWPTMVIRETYMDPISSPEEATYFSTSLWWSLWSEEDQGFMLGINPDEFDDGSGDEIEDLIIYMRDAQREVNEVLEKCRQQLVIKLNEIKAKLITAAEEN